MRFFAIRLDCQLLSFPKHVDLQAMTINLKSSIAVGWGKASFNKDGEQASLQAASYSKAFTWDAAPGTQNRSQAGGSPPAATRQNEIDLVRVEQSKDCRLLDQAA